MQTDSLGKKVFFIYPHSVIQNKLIQELIDGEYEVYFVNDHRKVESICEYYNSPVIFINIDEALEEPRWEELIRNIYSNEGTSHAKIGILTYNENAKLAQKYLMDIMVPCGFIILKLGLNDSTDIIKKTLDANEVKGKRKFVRARCNVDEANMNVTYKGKLRKGQIIDISSVGMAIMFNKLSDIEKNTYLKDIQIRLRGVLMRLSAVVIGHRDMEDDKVIFVLMFDQNVSMDIKSKLRYYINKTLQHEMEKKLKII